MKISATVNLDDVYTGQYEDRVTEYIERELEAELKRALRDVVREELRKAARIALDKSKEFKRGLNEVKRRVLTEELAKLDGKQ